jgi:hypothetical protein
MRGRWISVLLFLFAIPGFAAQEMDQLTQSLNQLKAQTLALETQLAQLQQKQAGTQTQVVSVTETPKASSKPIKKHRQHVKKARNHKKHHSVAVRSSKKVFHDSTIKIHSPNLHPESLEFYPTALIADNQVVTYIAGTPVISAPYLGARPAFDGSDYIVNISSINRDVRLMQQRRNLYRGYEQIGYPPPDVPIIALSGKVEPMFSIGRNFDNLISSDIDLGSDELDIAAVLNENVEAYMAIAYNASPPAVGGQRVANSSFGLNMGFVNIGNLDKTPLYFTAGQIYAPFGRYSSSMVSPTLPMILARTKTRPFIFGYKSREKTGPLVSIYGFKSDTTFGTSGVGGVNAAYIFAVPQGSGEIGIGYISSMANATGMQYTGSTPGTTFGGFASLTNGTEYVRRTAGANFHANVSIERYSITTEWVGSTERFRVQDLSYEGRGALPQAAQIEGAVTFHSFDRPSSVAVGYQWTSEAIALNVPKHRISGVYNISIWKDTVESLEYRHDIDYKLYQYGNGANSPLFPANQNTFGSGKSADTLILQLGVFF